MSFLGVYLPSDARALLENLQASRARSGPSRTVGREGVEREVERLLKTAHEDGLREIRQRAECIAGSLGAEQELQVLLDIIGTILGTRKAGLVARDVAARRRPDDPYDPECMERLKVLAMTLGRVAPDLADPHVGPGERDCTSFVEAYFTNYIEGTRFLVDKARRIVFEHEPADGRPQDGRDVTQTFAQVASIVPGEARASSVDEFMAEIRERNARLLDARPDKKPGEFKEDANSAGNTVFVLPDLVKGTLREGFAMLRDLQAPFARGVFAHTLIVLVHPFNDGNGRTARIMMTKELVGGGSRESWCRPSTGRTTSGVAGAYRTRRRSSRAPRARDAAVPVRHGPHRFAGPRRNVAPLGLDTRFSGRREEREVHRPERQRGHRMAARHPGPRLLLAGTRLDGPTPGRCHRPDTP
ncbi:Fic family protein [Methylorubrum aminovorans]|uniref:Fic family protein n=1 Tax=Methylorubrum aminovorans TaxID=269069 RepID=UPI0024E15ECC|nr:Fic family protein [Methylorubrum aminovorans]